MLTASNLHTVNEARSSAESGLEVIRYYLAQAEISGTTPQNEWFGEMKDQLLSAIMPNGITTEYFVDEDTGFGVVTIGSSENPVTLDSDQSFSAEIRDSEDYITIRITGNAGDIERNHR